MSYASALSMMRRAADAGEPRARRFMAATSAPRRPSRLTQDQILGRLLSAAGTRDFPLAVRSVMRAADPDDFAAAMSKLRRLEDAEERDLEQRISAMENPRRRRAIPSRAVPSQKDKEAIDFVTRAMGAHRRPVPGPDELPPLTLGAGDRRAARAYLDKLEELRSRGIVDEFNAPHLVPMVRITSA